MLILKYFATTGTLLTAALLTLNAYLEQSGSNAAARMPGSMTTASVFLVLPTAQTKGVANPDVTQPKVATTSTPTSARSAHHRRQPR
jgi:hypothetical protein